MPEVPQISTYFYIVTGLSESLEILGYDQEHKQEDNKDKLVAPITGRMEAKEISGNSVPFCNNIVKVLGLDE